MKGTGKHANHRTRTLLLPTSVLAARTATIGMTSLVGERQSRAHAFIP